MVGPFEVKRMSGPAEGKIRLAAKVYVVVKEKRKTVPAEVYIHLKGFAFARVTHLDIEHNDLEGIIRGRGEFLTIAGIPKGLRIETKRKKADSIDVLCPKLSKVMPNKRVRTWVGGKPGGIYIGFRREQILKLERVANK